MAAGDPNLMYCTCCGRIKTWTTHSEYRRTNAAADKLAREVAKLVEMKIIDERSAASDAMLSYMEVGSVDGPKSVPEWCHMYDLGMLK